MSMRVIMDLRPKGTGFEISKSGKSAVLLCEFSGRFKSVDTIDIELMVSKQTSFGRPVDMLIKELNEIVAAGSLLRATGQLEKLAYQEREGGCEVEKFRLIAYQIEESYEQEPLFSIAAVQGNVKPHGNSPIYKEVDGKHSTSFLISSEPERDYQKVTFLTVFTSAFGALAQRINSMKIKEKSYIMATGRLEAANSPGLLMLKLTGISYAKFPKKKEKE